MRKLMDEQRTGINIFNAISFFYLKRSDPFFVPFSMDRKSRRSHGQHVKDHGFAVFIVPSGRTEIRFPASSHGIYFLFRPAPIASLLFDKDHPRTGVFRFLLLIRLQNNSRHTALRRSKMPYRWSTVRSSTPVFPFSCPGNDNRNLYNPIASDSEPCLL